MRLVLALVAATAAALAPTLTMHDDNGKCHMKKTADGIQSSCDLLLEGGVSLERTFDQLTDVQRAISAA